MAAYKKSAQTKQSILDAAVQMVLDEGYANFSIKELSGRMGIPRSLIYYYFENKAGIMSELYRMRYADIEAAAERVLSGGEDPLVKLMLKYVLFRRFIVWDDLFSEFILTYPTYASLGPFELSRTTEEYYHDSISAFSHYGIALNGYELQAHVLSIDALSRALYQGIANGALRMNDIQGTMFLAEHAIMPTFHITKAHTAEVVNQAHALSERIASVESNYQLADYGLPGSAG